MTTAPNDGGVATAALEVAAAGAYASLQDRGRRGWRRIGVPGSGMLDTRLMRIANALVGNDASAPAIECVDGGQQFTARGAAVRVAVAGDADVEVVSGGQTRKLAPWCSLTLSDGDTLRLRKLLGGRIAVVAVEGVAVAPVLGSASTYPRAGLGGLNGRPLAAGDRVPVAPASRRGEWVLPQPPRRDTAPIRVVAGPQDDCFDAAAWGVLVSSDYRVTADADRMGVRLDGAPLTHRGAPEIVSDATVPGSIQVPGNGRPIVLLVDAQTAGGYPKIATVIGADLARVAACRPGDTLRFAGIDAADAERVARAAEAETQRLVAMLRPLLDGGIDEAALYSQNLISGVEDALRR